MGNNKRIKVIIQPDGVTGKTLNPFGDKPDMVLTKKSLKNTIGARNAWKKAESQREVYKIEPETIVIGHNGLFNEWGTIEYKPGSTHQAIIIDKERKLIKIL